MSKVRDLLYSFIYNPTIDNRFEVAEEYFANQQYAIALTFYLKTAELSSDKNLQYYCLIRCARCFEIPGNRKHSVMTLLKHAISLLPERPEAYYYLSRLHENYKDWFDTYLMADIGTTKTKVDDIYSKKLNYPSLFGCIFQKAVGAWHIGKSKESRNLFHYIKDNLYNDLDPEHKRSVQQNIIQLGSGEPFIYYTRDRAAYLRFKFKHLAKIERSYSQSMQDIFILSILDGKHNGTYLEIGSADPYWGNNTFILERFYDWTGVGLEINSKFIENYAAVRTNKILNEDALTVDYVNIIEQITDTKIVDYLQLDAEPATTTYEILLKIPFDKYKFRIITYEHDYYADVTQKCRDLSRSYLQNLGYKLVVNDVCADKDKRCSFEDWWVHPELVDSNILKIMEDSDLSTNKYVDEYMYKAI